MVKISQKCAYIFLLAFGFLTVSFCQASSNDYPMYPDYPASQAAMDSYYKQVAQWQQNLQQNNNSQNMENMFNNRQLSTNFKNLGIIANDITGNVHFNQDNITTIVNNRPKKDKKNKQKNGNNNNSNGQNLYPSNQSQQPCQQQNQYQPRPQNRVNQNISFGSSSGSNFSGIGNINQFDSSQEINQNISFGQSSGSSFSGIGNIGRQPQQNQQQQQPPVVHSAASTEPTPVQAQDRDKAIERYKKIIDDANSNIGYNDKLLVIEGNLSNELKKETLSHITITDTERNGISFIQYSDEEKKNLKKNAIGHAIFFSGMLNQGFGLKDALDIIKNKKINDSISKILQEESFNKTLSEDLHSKEYVNKIKEQKKQYYQRVTEDYRDRYKAWHVNNIVVLHNFEITSECDYVELRARLTKLYTNTSDSFVLIIEQENGDPFQVLVNKYDNAIEILTTQAITPDFQQFIMNIFGRNAIKDKFLENRIMELERKNHKNQDCFAAVVKAIGIDKEDINAFLKTHIVNKENKGSVQNSTKSNNENIKTKTRECGQETVVSQLELHKTICLETENVEGWKWVFNEAWTFAKEHPVMTGAMATGGIILTYLFISRLFSRSSSNTIVREVFDGYTHTTTYSDGSSSVKNNYSNNRIWH